MRAIPLARPAPIAEPAWTTTPAAPSASPRASVADTSPLDRSTNRSLMLAKFTR
jgi:hypothetical protein